MNAQIELLFNPFFYIPVITFVVGQAIKVGLHLAKGQNALKYLLASGGMPSVHTATVVALATTAVFTLGATEPLTGVLVIFAFIVVYDSFGVRRSAGEQAITLNRLIADLSKHNELSGKYKHLREILGHKPEETAAGGALGLLSGWVLVKYPGLLTIFTIEKLFDEPVFSATTLRGFLMFFGSILVAGVLLKIWFAGKKISPAKKNFHNKLFIFSLVSSLYGLFYAYVAFEGVAVLSFPIWFILGVAALIAWGITLSSHFHTKYQAERDEWSESERKNKWLT